MGFKRGNEVKIVEKVDYKEMAINLKAGDSIKVVVGLEDYVQYDAHNEFSLKIYPQSCLSLFDSSVECPYCKMAKLEEGLKAKQRMKFAFYVVDEKKIKFWDSSFTQGKKLMEQIKGYAEDIEYGSVFEFKRTGNGKETSYTLDLVAERKYKKEDKEAIEAFKGMTIETDMFEDICRPRSREMVIGLLNDAGLPVTKHFPDAQQILDDYEKAQQKEETTEDADNPLGF